MRTTWMSAVVMALISSASACDIDSMARALASASARNADAGIDASSAQGGSATGADAGTRDEGIGCATDLNSGVTLCASTRACPQVVVDTQAFPHCGFRVTTTSVSLACGCGESVCSMGAYGSCDEAAVLLRTQTELRVCTQVAEGRCSEKQGATSTGQGGGAVPKSCDRECLRTCGGGAACATLCQCSSPFSTNETGRLE